VDRFHMAERTDKWRALVNKVMTVRANGLDIHSGVRIP